MIINYINYGCTVTQNLPVNSLGGLKKHLNLRKISKKAIMKKVIKDIFLKVIFNILEKYMTFTMNSHNLLRNVSEKWKIKNHMRNHMIHIRNLKQVLNHGLVFKKVLRVM